MFEYENGMANRGKLYLMNEELFDSGQIYLIKEGLKDGLDVSKYANPKFIFPQMEEIIVGLRDGLDVDAFAKPEFT